METMQQIIKYTLQDIKERALDRDEIVREYRIVVATIEKLQREQSKICKQIAKLRAQKTALETQL